MLHGALLPRVDHGCVMLVKRTLQPQERCQTPLAAGSYHYALLQAGQLMAVAHDHGLLLWEDKVPCIFGVCAAYQAVQQHVTSADKPASVSELFCCSGC